MNLVGSKKQIEFDSLYIVAVVPFNRWPVKTRQMSIKVGQNDFIRKMTDFGNLTKIA